MRTLKIKKKVFEKEILDIGMKIVILDICEIMQENETTTYDFSRMYWVLPSKLEKVVPLEEVQVKEKQQKIKAE